MVQFMTTASVRYALRYDDDKVSSVDICQLRCMMTVISVYEMVRLRGIGYGMI